MSCQWKGLIDTLKLIFKQLTIQNSNNKVSVINFSCGVIIECECSDPLNINSNNFKFQNGGTNFSQALIDCCKIISKFSNDPLDFHIIFMSDGESSYPKNEINEIKKIQDSSLKDIKFDAIEFQTQGNILKDMTKELNGKIITALDIQSLKTAYFEIIKK